MYYTTGTAQLLQSVFLQYCTTVVERFVLVAPWQGLFCSRADSCTSWEE